jgi:radical SAM superfamily enzyme YgiQ (UPF0313 family)
MKIAASRDAGRRNEIVLLKKSNPALGAGSSGETLIGFTPRRRRDRTVVLVDFNWTRDKDPRIPLGHASILTCLKRVPNVNVVSKIIPVNARPEAADVAVALLAIANGIPDSDVDFAFGAYVWAEDLLREVLTLVRAGGFGGRIILGGPQVSYAGAGLESIYPEVDAFIRGDGENALCDVVARNGRECVTGVHWAGTKDAQAAARTELSGLPSPWLGNVLPVQRGGFMRWETQRGCSFRCSFCQHRAPGQRTARRLFAIDRINDEIDLFCAESVTDIAVLDPIFNAASHAVDVLERFHSRGYGGSLSLQCRAELIDDRFLSAASGVNARLEFGLQTIHDEEGRAIDRANNLGRVDRTLEFVRERSIPHEVSLIFGLPRQTMASFEASVSWCLERRVPVIKAFPLMLLRGTPLERDRDEWGLIDDGTSMAAVVQSTSFTREDWDAMGRISEALLKTEGRHPSSIAELRALADELVPDHERWRPQNETDRALHASAVKQVM